MVAENKHDTAAAREVEGTRVRAKTGERPPCHGGFPGIVGDVTAVVFHLLNDDGVT